jgi:hypothetical protein
VEVRQFPKVIFWVAALACLVTEGAGAATGSFHSSDPLLDRIWVNSVQTATDMISAGPITSDALGRPCAIPLLTVILDGTVRDRCPYIGDEEVIDAVYDVSEPHFGLQRSMLTWFAGAQHSDGAIPDSPIFGGAQVLFDYNAYWLQALHQYVLYSGDVGLARKLWPNVVRLVDGWYRAHLVGGLLENDLGSYDYAFVRRHGNVVAYYNAQAVVAIRDAAELARWIEDTHANGWSARANALAAASHVFWDPAAGAFADTTVDRTTHPQDGNSFAVLAGIGAPAERVAALAYLWVHNVRSYGNTISDSQTWDDPAWGYQASERVYPFMSYFELLARFKSGDAANAVNLIRREWGYMLANGPGTMWETIGPFGGKPTDQQPSFDAGWSAGAAAALTGYVLGVKPTSPGFATFTVFPHNVDLSYITGDVPTPHGTIHVDWRSTPRGPSLKVRAPPGTRWTNVPRQRRKP